MNAPRQPLVSVIVRTKDRPNLLLNALKSISEQNYRPIEVVLVNDGGCGLDRAELETTLGDVSLRYVRLERSKGRAGAGNVGIENTQGEYIGFLDDDDELYPDHVSTLVDAVRRSGCKVAYADSELVVKEVDAELGVMVDKERRTFASHDFSYEDLLVGNYIPLNTLLFSGELLRKVGGFDETFDLYEDWDLLIRIGSVSPFSHIPKVTSIYNQWNGSLQIAQSCDTAVMQDAFARILNKHHEKISPEVILNLKHKQERLVSELKAALDRYDKNVSDLNGELSQRIAELSLVKGELSHRDTEVGLKNDELAKVKAENSALIAEINALYATLGWRLLTRIRRVREGLLPEGTKRRALYQKAVESLKKRGIGGTLLRVVKGPKAVPGQDSRDYHAWIREHEPDDAELDKQREEARSFTYRPLVSIIVPVYNTDRDMLIRMLESVLAQTYEDWELCIADGHSKEVDVREILMMYMERYGKIKVSFLEVNGHISGNSNEALALAEGEFVAFLDHDDELAPSALYEVVKLLNHHPELDFIYSDEDKIDEQGKRTAPFFKPDWSPDLLYSVNYVCHLAVLRTSLVKRLRGFRSGYEGSQDYDLFLRASAVTSMIGHVPRILYHWRMHEHSTSGDVSRKDYADRAGRAALADVLKRSLADVYVTPGQAATNYRVRYPLKGDPLVSIIIPFRDKVDLLKTCVGSIMSKSGRTNYELLLVSNGSREDWTHQYLDAIGKHPGVRVLGFDEEFNYARINNFGALHARGDYLLFLNNDTEVISEHWLQSMLEHAQRKEIGAVGCKLLFPDGTIQHAGVVVGMTGYAGHVFAGLPDHSFTYFGSTDFERNVLAVTGACMMVRKEVFEGVGGFNEQFVLCGNDVDLCLRIHERGFRNLYTPYAVLYHYESASRRSTPIPATDFRASLESYAKYLASGDPFYNQNLTLLTSDCSLRRTDEERTLQEIRDRALVSN